MELNPNLSNRAREDLVLLERARNGDQKAFAELLSKYRDAINYMVLKMVHNRDDAEDITIESFGKAFSNLDRYTPEYAFSTWLFKIATNNAIDFIRRKRIQTLSLDYENEDNVNLSDVVKSDLHDPEEKFIRHQRSILLREIIDKLNPKYGRLIQLRYFDELSYEEIALELNIPLGTVKAQLFRAKSLLYNILKNAKGKY